MSWTISTTGLSDVYFMYQTEYYKVQQGLPFTFLFSQLGTRASTGAFNNTAAISANVMVVVVNPDTANVITSNVIQNSQVSFTVYYFPYYSYGIGATGGILFFMCFGTLFVMFCALFTCILYDCLDSDTKMMRKRKTQGEYHRIPQDHEFIHPIIEKQSEREPGPVQDTKIQV